MVNVLEDDTFKLELAIKQCIQERVKPVLFIDKMDEGMKKLDYKGEKIYKRLFEFIANINLKIIEYGLGDHN